MIDVGDKIKSYIMIKKITNLLIVIILSLVSISLAYHILILKKYGRSSLNIELSDNDFIFDTKDMMQHQHSRMSNIKNAELYLIKALLFLADKSGIDIHAQNAKILSDGRMLFEDVVAKFKKNKSEETCLCNAQDMIYLSSLSERHATFENGLRIKCEGGDYMDAKTSYIDLLTNSSNNVDVNMELNGVHIVSNNLVINNNGENLILSNRFKLKKDQNIEISGNEATIDNVLGYATIDHDVNFIMNHGNITSNYADIEFNPSDKNAIAQLLGAMTSSDKLILTFRENVILKTKEYTVTTDAAVYDHQAQIAQSMGPISIITSNGMKMEARHFIYDITLDQIVFLGTEQFNKLTQDDNTIFTTKVARKIITDKYTHKSKSLNPNNDITVINKSSNQNGPITITIKRD